METFANLTAISNIPMYPRWNYSVARFCCNMCCQVGHSAGASRICNFLLYVEELCSLYRDGVVTNRQGDSWPAHVAGVVLY